MKYTIISKRQYLTKDIRIFEKNYNAQPHKNLNQL